MTTEREVIEALGVLEPAMGKPVPYVQLLAYLYGTGNPPRAMNPLLERMGREGKVRHLQPNPDGDDPPFISRPLSTYMMDDVGWLAVELVEGAPREEQIDDWRDLPQGVYEGANRYVTDDQDVLTLWRDGQTWDVRSERCPTCGRGPRGELNGTCPDSFHDQPACPTCGSNQQGRPLLTEDGEEWRQCPDSFHIDLVTEGNTRKNANDLP